MREVVEVMKREGDGAEKVWERGGGGCRRTVSVREGSGAM